MNFTSSFGKDEVTRSNRVISSIGTPQGVRLAGFLVSLCAFLSEENKGISGQTSQIVRISGGGPYIKPLFFKAFESVGLFQNKRNAKIYITFCIYIITQNWYYAIVPLGVRLLI
ncbi:MAG TPA: hypothetical protein PKJ47_07140 [Candidatus Limiplasma sp.]|nr:hypothetical protein [Candidatus Limiplasma sp.]